MLLVDELDDGMVEMGVVVDVISDDLDGVSVCLEDGWELDVDILIGVDGIYL